MPILLCKGSYDIDSLLLVPFDPTALSSVGSSMASTKGCVLLSTMPIINFPYKRPFYNMVLTEQEIQVRPEEKFRKKGELAWT